MVEVLESLKLWAQIIVLISVSVYFSYIFINGFMHDLEKYLAVLLDAAKTNEDNTAHTDPLFWTTDRNNVVISSSCWCIYECCAACMGVSDNIMTFQPVCVIVI